MLKRYVDQGARRLWRAQARLRIDDPRNMTLYAACAELKLPLLFHLDEQRNIDASGSAGARSGRSKSIPTRQFIGHGPGWWASISGNVQAADLARYPDGPVAPGGAIDTLMDKYTEFVRRSIGRQRRAARSSRDPDFGRQFLIRRADRLDVRHRFSRPGQDVPQLTLFRQLQLPADVQAKIFRDNARKLLGLSEIRHPSISGKPRMVRHRTIVWAL